MRAFLRGNVTEGDLIEVTSAGRVADVHRTISLDVSEPAPVAHGARLTAVGADSETF